MVRFLRMQIFQYLNDASSPNKFQFQISIKSVDSFGHMIRLCIIAISYLLLCKLNYTCSYQMSYFHQYRPNGTFYELSSDTKVSRNLWGKNLKQSDHAPLIHTPFNFSLEQGITPWGMGVHCVRKTERASAFCLSFAHQ